MNKKLKIKDGIHLECGSKLIIKEGMFHWRGKCFSGLFCEQCNALFNNPADSFESHIVAP